MVCPHRRQGFRHSQLVMSGSGLKPTTQPDPARPDPKKPGPGGGGLGRAQGSGSHLVKPWPYKFRPSPKNPTRASLVSTDILNRFNHEWVNRSWGGKVNPAGDLPSERENQGTNHITGLTT